MLLLNSSSNRKESSFKTLTPIVPCLGSGRVGGCRCVTSVAEGEKSMVTHC